MQQTVKIAIGLGSNLGNRQQVLETAAKQLAVDFLQDPQASSVWETPPWGVLEQPDFLNAVVVGTCDWKPPAVINYLKRLETQLGRVPGPRYGPRHLDLDLLVYGGGVWSSEGIEVPHPAMADREFVLAPLAELWPDWKHPILGKRVSTLLDEWLQKQSSGARITAPPLSFP